MNFFEFAETLKNYSTSRFIYDLQSSLEKNSDVIQLQKDQWKKGLDAHGVILGLYSMGTEAINPNKKAGTPFTLFDTGDFYEQTHVFGNVKDNDLLFNFDSSGTNTVALIARLGERIFGLQENNKDQFTMIAQDVAIEILNTNLKLK
jgi:hypothetical protein